MTYSHYTTTVSPSPRELFERLTDEERVAVDAFIGGAEPGDERIARLTASEGRRKYLTTLANQLKALGFGLSEDPGLDAKVRQWHGDHEAYQRSLAEARASRERRTAELRAAELIRQQEIVEAQQQRVRDRSTLPQRQRRELSAARALPVTNASPQVQKAISRNRRKRGPA